MSTINPYRPNAVADATSSPTGARNQGPRYRAPGDTYANKTADLGTSDSSTSLLPTSSDSSDPYAGVDWSKVDYSGVDWSRVDYGAVDSAAATAAAGGNSNGVAPAAASGASNASVVSGDSTEQAAKVVDHTVAPAAASSAGRNPAGTVDADGYSLAGFGSRTDPVDNGNKDEYKGNVGSPYGSNMQMVDAADADKYKYTNTFTNTTGQPQTISLWNKVGPDGQPNSGQSSTPALTITLAPGASQTVAFDENSQVAWAQNGFGSTASGSPDTTWGEADFGDLRNQAWSGYDVSSIQNTAGNNYAMSITSNGGEASTNTSNNWTSDVQANMGAGGVLTPGVVRLNTTMGGTI